MKEYEPILHALGRSQMSKSALVRVTGITYGLIDRALQVLILEGKVVRFGARYKLVEKRNGKGIPAT